MTFTVQRLTGGRALVFGTDINGVQAQTSVSTLQWDEVNATQAYSQAESAFESAVDDFFAPLLEAAEKLQTSAPSRPEDPSAYIVLEESSPGVPATPGKLIPLVRDSIILRLIEQGDTTRLIWVNGELEILEILPATSVPVAPVTSTGDDEPPL